MAATDYVSGKLYNGTGIGDYVHYHLKNYQAFGLERPTNKDTVSGIFPSSAPRHYAGDALAQSHNYLKSQIAKNNRKVQTRVLSEFLTSFFYPDNATIDVSKNIGQNDLGAIKKELLNQIQEKWPLFIAKLEGLDFETLMKSNNIDPGYIYKGIYGKKTKSVQRETIKNQIQTSLVGFKQQIELLKNQYTKSAATVSALTKIMEKCDDYIAKLQKALQDYTDPDGIVIKKIDEKTGKKTYTEVGQLLRDINSFKRTSFGYPTKKDIGDLAEYAMAAALGVGGAVKRKAVNDLIDEFHVVGWQKSPTEYRRFSNLIYVDLVSKNLNKDRYGNPLNPPAYNYEVDGHIYSVNGSQDTVDISIDLQKGSYLYNELGLDTLQASIKNLAQINEEYGIHILGGAPLLSILELASVDFINHYLNLLALNPKSEMAIHYYKDEIRYMVAVRALSGMRSLIGDQKYSDCFIVNARKDRRVYVWGTGDLLDKIETLRDNGGLRDVLRLNGNALPRSLDNTFIEVQKGQSPYIGASIRISKLISQLHKYKIHASLIMTEFMP